MACKNCGKTRQEVEAARERRNNSMKLEKTRRGKEVKNVRVKN